MPTPLGTGEDRPRKVTAEEQAVNKALAKAFDKGYQAGWLDGVDDATKDEPKRKGINPYRREDS